MIPFGATPLFIFDLDGTIALIEHRKHLLEAADSNKWRRFYAACPDDAPNTPVISTMRQLYRAGCELWIFSGRSDEVKQQTIDWIGAHTIFTPQYLENRLVMRRSHDHRPDFELKQQFLDDMLVDDRKRLIAVFDDRNQVVDMWRKNGICCFQVAPGDF